MAADPHEIFAAGRLLARQKAPYFRAMLLGLVPREIPGLGTIGVTENGVLIWDPEFIATLTAPQMGGLFIHEVMHLCLKHSERARRAGLDPRLANIAGDLAINPSIIDMGLELPGGENKGYFPEDLGFERGLTRDEYYELLLQDAQGQGKGQKPQPMPGGGAGQGKGQKGQGEPDSDDHEGSGEGDGGDDADHDHEGGGSEGKGKAGHMGNKPQAGGGFCGSCAGRKMPGEPDEDPQARSDGELERMARQVAEAIREHASRNKGNVPGGWERWADGALEPPKIPWQTKLARLTRYAAGWRPGAVDHRYDAPGRRQAGIGYGPGKPILPRFRQPVPNVTVILDTSGSMGSLELGDAARETNGILKAIGADITLTVCDAAVHGLTKVRSIEEAVGMLRGGGGTDMRPGFDAAMKARPRPEIIICITDGCVGDGFPTQAPQGVKVITVLVGEHRMIPAPWCECIEVEPAAPIKVR